MKWLWLGLCLILGGTSAWAEQPSDPLAWMGRIATAGQRLTYSGTFTYQSGNRSETSRIVHFRDESGEIERLETLDGSPREVIRSNGEVRCVLPSQKTVIIDQAGGRRPFPARLADVWMGLSESYRIRRGEVTRVAGLEVQQIILEPKDDLRYGQILWADTQHGLLIKSRMVDERGQTIEQFAFSEVKVGGEVERSQLQSRFGGEAAGWRVINAKGSEIRQEDGRWTLRSGLPGFNLTSAVRRPFGGQAGESLQMVYSDGLAAVSLFIEPLSEPVEKVSLGAHHTGAINLYKRVVGNHLVTALGEVPPRSVQRIAEAVEAARR